MTTSHQGDRHGQAALRTGVTVLFGVSGAAGLVYQVLWMRALGLFFGSDLYGVTIVLATFMGGLALGSLYGGRLAERMRRPLVGYAIAEVAIGGFALAFSPALDALEPLLRLVHPGDAAAPGAIYASARIVLAAILLLGPTVCMGATLPLILQHFARRDRDFGARGATFYAVNTLGALVGTLVAGFALLPYLGMSHATAVTASVNFLVGVVCLVLGLRARAIDAIEASEDGAPPPATASSTASAYDRRVARLALVGFGLSGFASFALEVTWTRILLVSVSSTVYSFATMLACFLFGIFLGSALVARVVDRERNPLRLFAWLELGVGACVAGLCLAVNLVPQLFGGTLGLFFQVFPRESGLALVCATLVISFAFLVLPTTLLGATFAVALRVYTAGAGGAARIGSRSGNLYFANTLGAIVGSVGAGIVAIPTLGAQTTLACVSLVFVSVAGFLAAGAARREDPNAGASRTIVVASGLVALVALASIALPYRVNLNFNQRAAADAELLYHAEGVQNTIDVVRSSDDVTSLIIGGNVEADDGPTQLRHFVLKGHLPLLLHEDPKTVLVVGLGMGITLQSTALHDTLERVDVVELSPEILAAQSVLGPVNGYVAQHEKVRVRIDDGRHYMKMTERRYDMITADPIHPKISRVGYLYTREYYQALRSRLTPGGVVCQWMPIYQISPTRLRSAIKTFASVFPGASLWYVRNHALLIAREDDAPPDYGLLSRRLGQTEVTEDLARIEVHGAEDLAALLLLGPEDLADYVAADASVPINTDDHPYLEYFVPGDLFRRPVENVADLLRFEGNPARQFENASGEVMRRIDSRVEGRGTRLLEELAPTAPRGTGS
ncbi:MAG: fused MFS/spermidine synthase [Myxococcota bacterium]|jgi:spermidine synthase|nr:fused MFS/spermidine synthase [Myxococcota bacterium]